MSVAQITNKAATLHTFDSCHCHVFDCCDTSLCNKHGVLGRWTTNLASLHGNNSGILWYLYGGIP